MQGLISNIQRFSLHDGPGIRTTVFFQGCPLRCWWCHNPECIPIESTATGADKYSVSTLMEKIRKDRIFYEESGGGVSFSGGEPMVQALFLKHILQACKKEGIHTCIDTSGQVASCVLKEVTETADLVLFDLKLIDPQLHIKYTEVNNEKILKNLKMLDEQNINMRIRIPLIPGITDTVNNINEILSLLDGLKNNYPVDLLPYHKMASDKYERLGMENKLKKMGSEPELNSIVEEFTSRKHTVHIGG